MLPLQSLLWQGLRARSVISAVPYPHPKTRSFPITPLGREAMNACLRGDARGDRGCLGGDQGCLEILGDAWG